jgi:trk system potassium uptake protein TrkH
VGAVLRLAIALALLGVALAKVGTHEPVLGDPLMRAGAIVLMGSYLASLYLTIWRLPASAERRKSILRVTLPEQAAAWAGLALCWWWPAIVCAAVVLVIVQSLRLYLRLVQKNIPPGLVFVGSFLLLVLAGTGLLMLPAATPRDQPISLVDAAFTITSAVSQTGLTVRPTGTGFTRFGQTIILIWIQIGALGVIVFGALVANLLGSGFGIKATKTIAEGTEQGWAGQLSMQKLVAFIVIVTHVFQLIGAVALFIGWPETGDPGWAGAPHDLETPFDRAFHAVFFSVSAFCNAGFATTEASLQGLRTHWTTHLVIAPLIVLGGIGFPVLENLAKVGWSRLRGVRVEGGRLIRINLNTKIVLSTTLIVYALGMVALGLGELLQRGGPVQGSLLDAHFMNINRTSGFDTMPPAEMGLFSVMTMVLLMFIGGSPGSVAGGIKVMVFAVLMLTVWSTLRGREETTAFGRTLPERLIRKSAVIAVLVLVGVLGTTAVMVLAESGAVIGAARAAEAVEHAGTTFGLTELLFEATSAFTTCGLSLGITRDVGTISRIALTVAMFVGRVGVFAVLASLLAFTVRQRAQVGYPTEEVMVY